MAFPKLFSSEQKYQEVGEEGGVEDKAPVKKTWPTVLTISIFLNILLAFPYLLGAIRSSLSLFPSPKTSQQVYEVYCEFFSHLPKFKRTELTFIQPQLNQQFHMSCGSLICHPQTSPNTRAEPMKQI
jgi:hypothetical protein